MRDYDQAIGFFVTCALVEWVIPEAGWPMWAKVLVDIALGIIVIGLLVAESYGPVEGEKSAEAHEAGRAERADRLAAGIRGH